MLPAQLQRLEKFREASPGQWRARCPAHEDSSPSLSIGTGDDGRILLYCFAGCPVEAVVSAAGLTMEDLAPRSQAGPGRASLESEAVYTYRDADGAELFEVCRLPGKQFRQRRRHGSGFAWGLSAGLYRSRKGGPDLYQL
ncbi:MAG: hypothetical protein KDD47_07170, partial [Acidobacteria bacterium]|nr:hypothetical protein [Acidobacteriota bacterium]